MKITKLTKHLGRTIGLKNFGSIKVDVALEATLEDNDSLEQVDQELYDNATTILRNDLKRIEESRKQKGETTNVE